MAPTREALPRSGRPSSSRHISSEQERDDEKDHPAKWSMGVMNDRNTIEVPGSVLLLARGRNEPLGLRNAPARTSHSSIPTGIPRDIPEPQPQPQPQPGLQDEESKKTTKDGKIILDPQPEDSQNDPLNWPTWRRDLSLVSLGLYCCMGGGLTPILAAGFTNVAADYGVSVSQVSLTTGLYMMGMGLGSVVFSPTAILWGKRPVYLGSAVLLIVCSVWCAVSPNFTSLLVARIFQGVAVSPVECLPSATIAEIFFLHERAFRIGIYTLLLLGGKNLVPLVSAAVIQRLGWRWVFWIVTFVVAFCGTLLFFFVPESFWDRAPIPKSRKPPSTRPSILRRLSSRPGVPTLSATPAPPPEPAPRKSTEAPASPTTPHHRVKDPHAHVGFAADVDTHGTTGVDDSHDAYFHRVDVPATGLRGDGDAAGTKAGGLRSAGGDANSTPLDPAVLTAKLGAVESGDHATTAATQGSVIPSSAVHHMDTDSEKQSLQWNPTAAARGPAYTHTLRDQPARSFAQQLKPWHGRLTQDKWLKVMVRPLILVSYPAVAFSSILYSLSIGWLIVISEAIAVIYRDPASYNFTASQAGYIYVSPFVGGILGTAVAGKVSDVIVRAMAARNGGLYEPEFRLVMVLPIALCTGSGLIGFGWSAQEHDAWIVPTVFFGLVSFGCSLGSTTAITFCVDSYRQYAGEALVTLNFIKNIFHGLVWSFFVTEWITVAGPRWVFIWIGVIQLLLLLLAGPMYIYGKRLRMWTVRKNLMEKF